MKGLRRAGRGVRRLLLGCQQIGDEGGDPLVRLRRPLHVAPDYDPDFTSPARCTPSRISWKASSGSPQRLTLTHLPCSRSL